MKYKKWLFSFLVPIAFAVHAENWVKDDGFEAEKSSWILEKQGASFDTTEKHSGTRSLKLSDFKGSSAIQKIPVNQTEAQPLEISVWCKSAGIKKKSPKSRTYLLPVAIFQNGQSDYHMEPLAFEDGNSDWSKRMIHYIPRSPLKELDLYLILENCEGNVWVDDVSVGTAGKSENGDNCLKNASFLQGGNSWKIWNGFIDLGTGREGSPNSLCFSFPDEKTQGAHATQKVTLDQKEAAPILFSVWSKTKGVLEKGKSQDYYMHLTVFYQDGTTNWQVPPQYLNFSNHDWEKKEYIYNPPKPVKAAELYLVFRKNIGTVWFDDAEIKELKSEKTGEKIPCKVKEAPDESGAMTVQMENAYVRLVIDPAGGGTCKSFIDKRTNTGFTGENMDYRMFTDRLREQTRTALFKQPFSVKILNDSSETVSLELLLDPTPGFPWVTFSKVITITRDSPLVKITYQFHNKPASMAPVVISPYFRSGVSVIGKPTTFFYPLSKEMKSDLNTAGGGPVYLDAVKGWIGGTARDGTGIACEYDFSRLAGITAWYGGMNQSTLEWWFSPVSIKNGETFSTDVVWLPLNGLKSIDSVENGIAGSFIEQDGKYGYALVSGKRISCSMVAEAEYKDSEVVRREQAIALSPDKNAAIFFDFPNKESIRHIRFSLVQNGKTFFSAEKPFTKEYQYQPGTAKVPPAEVKPFTLTLSQKVETPHIPWCIPYYKGKTKILGLIDYRHGRELVELAQRMDIHFNTARLSDNLTVLLQDLAERYLQFNFDDANASLEALLTEKYDVIIVSGNLWKRFNSKNVETIRKMAESGTGLILIHPGEVPASILPLTPLRSPNPNSKLQMNFSGNSLSGIGTYGSTVPFSAWKNGQFSNYDFSPNAVILAKSGKYPFLVKGGKNCYVISYLTPALLPMLLHEEKFPGYNYTESQFPFLIRTILEAAGKAPETELRNLSVQGKRLNFELTGNPPGKNLSARIFLESVLTSEKKESTVKINAAVSSYSLELPAELAPGENLVKIILLSDGKVFNWGGCVAVKQPAAEITGLETDTEILYCAGDRVNGTLAVSGKAAKINVQLKDAWGRIIARQTVPSGKFSIEIPEASTRRMYLQAEAVDGDVLQDRKEVSLQVALDPADEGYTISTGDNHMASDRNRFFQEEYYRILRELGVDTLRLWTANRPWAYDDYLRLNFSFIFPVFHGKLTESFTKAFVQPYLKTKDKKYLCRKPCLHDKSWEDQIYRTEENTLRALAKYSPVAVDFGDENSLTAWSQRFDFCFSPATLAAFRQWLKGQYGTLNALNQEWGTNFPDWENVVPSTTDEIQKSARDSRNYAAWADHRRFMDLSYAAHFEKAAQQAKTMNGKLSVDLSGIQPPTAFDGMDWWLFSKFMDRASFYREQKNDEIITAFHSVRSTAWYGYGATGDQIGYDLWNDAFRSRKSGASFFSGCNILNPDFTVPKATSDFFDAAKDLRLGIGSLLESLEPSIPEVLVHYSMSSLRTHDLEGRLSEYIDCRTAWTNLLSDLNLRYRFISYEEIEQGKLAASSAQIFVMPLSISISGKEADEIRKFVSSGGILLADRMAGIMNEHSRKLPKGLLDDVFGLDRPDDHTQGIAAFSFQGLDFKLPVGSAVKKDEDRKAIFTNRYGKGKALFLNTLPTGYSSLRPSLKTQKDAQKYTALLEGFCKDVLGGQFMKITADGVDIPHTRSFLYHQKSGSANAYFIGLLREEGTAEEVKLRLSAGKAFHVYSVRDGNGLGLQKETLVTIRPAEAKLIAFMPYRIEKVELLAPRSCKQGDRVELTVGIIAQGEKMDHPVRLEFFQPDGKRSYFYSRNITARKGLWKEKIHLALNEMPGKWQIVAKDIISGEKQSITINVEKGK